MLKKILVLLVAILLLAGAALGVMFFRFDADAFQQKLAASLKEYSGEEVSVEGTPTLTLSPSPALHVDKINVSNRFGDIIFDADSVKAHLSLWSLLTGEPVISGMNIKTLSLVAGDNNGIIPLITREESTMPETLASLASISVKEMHIKIGADSSSPSASLTLSDNVFKRSSGNGFFTLEGKYHRLSYAAGLEDIGDTWDVSISLDGQSGDAHFEGSIEEFVANGDFRASISDITAFLSEAGIHLDSLQDLTIGNSLEIAQASASLSLSGWKIEDVTGTWDSSDIKGSVGWNASEPLELSLITDVLNIDTILHGKDTNIGFRAVRTKKPERYIRDLQDAIKAFVLPDYPANIAIDAAEVLYRGHGFSYVTFNTALRNKRADITFNAENLPGQGSLRYSGNAETDDQNATTLSGTVTLTGQSLPSFVDWMKGVEKRDPSEHSNRFQTEIWFKADSSVFDISTKETSADELQFSGRIQINAGETVAARASVNVGNINLDHYSDSFIGEKATGSYPLLTLLYHLGMFDTLVASVKMDNATYRSTNFKDFSTLLRFKDKVLTLNKIAFGLGEGRASGEFTFDGRTPKPVLTSDIRFDRLDTDWLTPFFNPTQYTVEVEAWGKRPLEAFGLIDGTIRFSAENFTHNRIAVKNAETFLKLGEQSITIAELKGRVFDSNIHLKEGEIGVQTPSFKLSFSLANADAESMLKSVLGYNGISGGRAGVSVSLAAVGHDIQQWHEGLQGSVNVVTRGINLNNVDIALLPNRLPLLNAIADVRLLANQVISSGKTPVNYASILLTATQGVFSVNKAIISHEGLLDGTLQGSIDPLRSTINLTSEMKVKVRGFTEVPLSFNISGAMDSPKTFWTTQGIENYWAKNFFGTP